ncbi:MAG: DUF1574 domain-containing protein [Bacteroidales bacterium]|nr:DUF1574 domain-containing protein [Bacteroidales bacterium]
MIPKKEEIKRIFKKGIFLLLPIYAVWVLYIEFMPMYYNRPTNTRWYFLKESLSGKYKIPEANKIFLGESRLNAGIDFTKIDSSYSFASGGSSPVEMYYIFKKYLQKHRKPDTVFLSISPRFFSEIFAFWHYAVRNNVIDYSDFKEIISLKEKNDTVLGGFCIPNFFLYKADYLGYYQDDVLYNYVFTGYAKNEKMIAEMQKMCGARPHPGLKDSCSVLNYETKYKHFLPSPLLETYFNKILNLCRKENIKLIFFSMPMNESSFKKLTPDFISEYEIFINRSKKHFPEFEISDSLYFYADKFFGDASHLNKK